jgi:hypothetical protein
VVQVAVQTPIPPKKLITRILAGHGGNLSTWKAEAGGSQVQGQTQLHKKTVSQKKNLNYFLFYVIRVHSLPDKSSNKIFHKLKFIKI